ncbi:Rossmann-like domain-containing protein [Natronorubrum sp. FCH18a]|uniref:Rossmann-like domain-containing protein n=1 Tax=Natronorubrum sp. FCH18a TaxID=3447018 RepID=UPI003F51AC54
MIDPIRPAIVDRLRSRGIPEAAPPEATVVLIGATASGLPEPAFEADVDVVAGADVVAPDRVRDAVKQGACGTDLHDAGVRKVYTVADGVADPDGGLRGPTRSNEPVERSERRSDTTDRSDSNQ